MFSLSLLLALLVAGPDDSSAAKTLFKPDLFQTLVDPDCSYCRDEAKRAGDALRDDDRVLAWIRGQHDGGAIPYRWFLVPFRVLSDTYGVFVYDADADFVRAWPPSVDFRFQGWRNGVMVMKDKDGTLFDCLTGVAFEGPRKGERLVPLPSFESNWGPWLKANPGTVAYMMYPKFKPMPLPAGVLSESLQTRPAPDARLGPEQRVFGLAIGAQSVAFPLTRFGVQPELLKTKLSEQDAVILWEPSTRTAVSFAPETEGKNPEQVTLSVDLGDRDAPFIDRETGSHWSMVGRAVSGSRKGASLRWLPGVMIKWYAWAAEYPKTEIGS